MGIQEAIAALSTPPNGGGTVEIESNFVYVISSTINVPSNIDLISNMNGGEIDGPAPASPAGYLNFIPPTGSCVKFGPDVGRSSMKGIAVQGVTSDPLVLRTGCLNVDLEDCFIYNNSPNSIGVGLQTDGLTRASTACNAKRLLVVGNPAIQVGISGEAYLPSDCTWDDVTAEGPVNASGNFQTGSTGTVLSIFEGNNHLFKNFYCRGIHDQISVSGGSVIFRGGEMRAIRVRNPISRAVNLNQTGGVVEYEDLTVSYGTINVSGGVLRLRRTKLEHTSAGGSINTELNVSGGVFEADRLSDFPSTQITKTGGTSYLPSGGRLSPNLGVPSALNADLPGDLTSSLTNPPGSGTKYHNATGSRLTVMVPIQLGAGVFPSTIHPRIGPINPAGVLAIAFPVWSYPATAPPNLVVVVTIDVPSDWWWSVLVFSATILSAIAIGEASD